MYLYLCDISIAMIFDCLTKRCKSADEQSPDASRSLCRRCCLLADQGVRPGGEIQIHFTGRNENTTTCRNTSQPCFTLGHGNKIEVRMILTKTKHHPVFFPRQRFLRVHARNHWQIRSSQCKCTTEPRPRWRKCLVAGKSYLIATSTMGL